MTKYIQPATGVVALEDGDRIVCLSHDRWSMITTPTGSRALPDDMPASIASTTLMTPDYDLRIINLLQPGFVSAVQLVDCNPVGVMCGYAWYGQHISSFSNQPQTLSETVNKFGYVLSPRVMYTTDGMYAVHVHFAECTNAHMVSNHGAGPNGCYTHYTPPGYGCVLALVNKSGYNELLRIQQGGSVNGYGQNVRHCTTLSHDCPTTAYKSTPSGDHISSLAVYNKNDVDMIYKQLAYSVMCSVPRQPDVGLLHQTYNSPSYYTSVDPTPYGPCVDPAIRTVKTGCPPDFEFHKDILRCHVGDDAVMDVPLFGTAVETTIGTYQFVNA